MKINQIRKTFLDFFESKGHKIVPSAPMVIKNDPTLMFTNAGMNQFKDFFLGFNTAKDKRVANTQKCLRVSGKQNDLEEVGVDTYHHTMFEMLGNWSFGDYFKEEVIAWAWELLTEVYKLDTDRIYITVFEGDEKDGTKLDQESINYWKKWIDPNRIILANKKDNFWEMGDTGPCGPCSEIHVDIRSEEEREKVDGKSLVNKDHPQVIEIWNLVFMQFNRKANGELVKLEETHIDTGMGLERLAMVMQAKQSNYDIDLFQTLVKSLSEISGKSYGKTEEIDIALRVVVDHVRAIAFSIIDGQLPSNTGAGYVIRRILRRAVRYGYQKLEIKEPFICKLVAPLIKEMGDYFPELKKQEELITKVIREEEASFFHTLAKGISKIQKLIDKVKAEKQNIIAGADVFELFDTFGFPIDLTLLIAQENNVGIDEKEFDRLLKEQQGRGREATKIQSDDWVILENDQVEEFVGYDLLKADIRITKYRKVEQNKKTFYQLVFNLTPFYAEGGGQVGDRGWIEPSSSSEITSEEKCYIFDTKKENNLIVHLVKELPKNCKIKFKAIVNKSKRQLTEANHSATHLLHHVLREVLGTHVEQKGSLVNEKYLRFDFSHFSKVTDEELLLIEEKVNNTIRANISLNEKRGVPMEVATEMGAMALFGEKYGDVVRIVQFGDSVELCGGTHVSDTTEIGMFKIVSEGSVASGIRRVEAITSTTAQVYFKEHSRQYLEICHLFKNPKDILKSIHELMDKNTKLTKEIETLKKEQLKQIKTDILSKVQAKGDINYIGEIVDLDAGAIRDLCFQLKGQIDRLFAVFGGKADGKATLTIIISDDLAKEKDLHAGNLVREAARLIQGGGGGQPFFATAGGKNSSGLKAAIEKVNDLAKL